MKKLHITTPEQIGSYAAHSDDQAVTVSLRLLRQLVHDTNLGAVRATEEEIAQAWHRHCIGSDDEIEITKVARVRRGKDGPWVEAWLFVPRECVDDYKPDESDSPT